MDRAHESNEKQARLWNGLAGRAWVDMQELLDQLYRPFEDMLVAAVGAESGSRVLDVGCGTGITTLAVARRLGAKGRCTAVRAFANLRRAAANDARLRFIAWIEARS